VQYASRNISVGLFPLILISSLISDLLARPSSSFCRLTTLLYKSAVESMRFLISVFITILATALYNRQHLLPLLASLNPQTPLSSTNQTRNAAGNMSAPKPSPTFIGLPIIPPNDPSLNAATSKPRSIRKVFEADEQAEGAGATVRRSVGTPQLRNITPFLMLDEFDIKPGSGFPDHPHRGQETITYLLSGSVDHEDFAGHKGTIETGDLQFMTAGRGIVHAEMPHQNEDGSSNRGLQLWVDLPEMLKDCEPRYRDVKAAEIPVAISDDGKVIVKVISGRSFGVDSLQELAYTPVWFLDITMKPGAQLSQSLPAKWNAFLYTLTGATTFGSGSTTRAVGPHHNVVFEQEGDTVVAKVEDGASEDSRFVLIAGLPLDQKIIQYGPFVVSKQEDIYKALFDYQSFSNGFERAQGFKSEIGQNMVH